MSNETKPSQSFEEYVQAIRKKAQVERFMKSLKGEQPDDDADSNSIEDVLKRMSETPSSVPGNNQ